MNICKVCGKPIENSSEKVCDECKEKMAEGFEGLADTYAELFNLKRKDVWNIVGEKCLW